jgi:hypothetical protein
MHYSYVEIEYVATSFSPARTDLALKLLTANAICALVLALAIVGLLIYTLFILLIRV